MGFAPPSRRRHWHLLHGPVSLLVWVLAWLGGVSAVAAVWLVQGPISLPDPMVQRLEARLGEVVLPAGLTARIAGAEVTLRDGLVPVAILNRVTLTDADGQRAVSLDRIETVLARDALLSGLVRPRAVRLSGLRLGLLRNRDGQLSVRLGNEALIERASGPGAVLAQLRAALDSPQLSRLRELGVEALDLQFDDLREARSVAATGGTLRLDRDGLSLRLSLVLGDITAGAAGGAGAGPGQARLDLHSPSPSDPTALTVALRGLVPAQLAPLGGTAPLSELLSRIDAPMTLDLSGTLTPAGEIGELSGQIAAGAGRIRLPGRAAPLDLDRASADLALSAARDLLRLSHLTLQGPEVAADGALDLMVERRPGASRPVTAQVRLTHLRLFPAGGWLAAPVTFSLAASDARYDPDGGALRLAGIVLDTGGLRLRGSASLADGAIAVDVGTERMDSAALLPLWPPSLAPGTRGWIGRNLLAGTITGASAAVRYVPGMDRPDIGVSFGFDAARLRPAAGLSVIERARGRATISHRAFRVAVDSAVVTDPLGGRMSLSDGAVVVPDIFQRGGTLRADFGVEAATGGMLAFLALPVFQGPDAPPPPENPLLTPQTATGVLDLAVSLSIPLKDGNTVADLAFAAEGALRDFRSATLVPGRDLEAGDLRLDARPDLLRLEGPVRLAGQPMEMAFRRPLGTDAPPAGVTARGALTDELLRSFGIAPPEGAVRGAGRFTADLELLPDRRPTLEATADLAGLALSVPALGWSKPAGTAGSVSLSGRLGRGARIERITANAPGLRLQGAIDLPAGPGQRPALALSQLAVGGWLDTALTLSADGALALTGGSFDLRRWPGGSGGSGGNGAAGLPGPVDLRLDRVTLTDTIRLSAVRGRLSAAGTGQLRARVGGRAPVTVDLERGADGIALRLRADDAGGVLRAADLTGQMRGGRLDLRLTPESAAGTYRGQMRIDAPTLRDTPVLADLVSAISVVGLLDQMSGRGIAFDEVRADFRLAPGRLTIEAASAVGASLGLSLDGAVDLAGRSVDLQGVVSPVYFLNRAGSFMTRRGEGLLGVSYTLRGPIASPQLRVNPLSALAPGFLRDLFRRPSGGRVTRDDGQP